MAKMRYQEVKAKARGRWGEIIQALCSNSDLDVAIDNIRDGKYNAKTYCPVHTGNSGEAFRLYPDFEDTGGGVCNSCGGFSSGFALLQWLNNWEFDDVWKKVREYLDGNQQSVVAQSVVTRSTKPKPDKDALRPELSRLKEYWLDAYTSDDPKSGPMRQYIERRGIDLDPFPTTVRMHLGMGYYNKDGKKTGTYPVMLAPIMQIDNRVVGLHRTYLTDDGHKADVACAKKYHVGKGCSLSGAAIRLAAAGEQLGVCEGIETGLAIMSATAMPVWVACNTGMMRSLKIPDHVKQVVVWADRDASGAGHDAAEAFAQRCREAGLAVSILYPNLPFNGRKGVDWNDVLKDKGAWAFPLTRTQTVVSA